MLFFCFVLGGGVLMGFRIRAYKVEGSGFRPLRV